MVSDKDGVVIRQVWEDGEKEETKAGCGKKKKSVYVPLGSLTTMMWPILLGFERPF